MALQKTPVNINFGKGMDTKTDPYQVEIGKYLSLVNCVFNTSGRLTKRNGYPNITSLPDALETTLTTLNGNLVATGSNLLSFSQNTNQWVNKGPTQPVRLDVQSMVKNSTNQTSADAVVTSSGLTCLAFNDRGGVYYTVSDSSTGGQVVSETVLAADGTSPRVFEMGRYFIITFIATIGGGTHLQYIAIPISVPTSPSAIFDISTTLVDDEAGYDAVVANNNLYIGWGDTGTTVNITYLTSSLILQAPVVIPASYATLMSVVADTSGSIPIIWMSYWDAGSGDGYSTAFTSTLIAVLAPTQILTATDINEITSLADSNVLTVYYENDNDYDDSGAYPVSNIKTDYISTLTVTIAGVVSSPTVIIRSVGLASKAFVGFDGNTYMIVTYGETNQPTYFLIDSTGHIYMRLAYANGGGYQATQILPSVSLVDSNYYVPYLFKDFLATVNKGTNLPANTPLNAIYTQTGVNLAIFSINDSGQYTTEIADTLHLTGGQMWLYDGVKPVEDGFHVWPENVQVTTSATGGSITAQKYNYVFTYEWTDNQGKLIRSAPSIPFTITTTGSTSTNTCYVPTLRLTYKVTPNPVRIVGYRWSVAQQVYYQFTSITSPTLNNPAVDYVVISDTHSDASILGQTLLYTTGGVIENIAPPAAIASTLYGNRLFIVDAEDQNLLWYSKVVIQGVPVEFSDLLTIYVAPTSGAQGSTGPITALSAMDDKLIVFKRDAIYYITGSGPDNTGANNDFSDPVFITSSVGCANPNSIVLMPSGLMFQSDKGIWLLGRDLSTQYIGAPMAAFNDQVVLSAQTIPGTNQVRFLLDNDITLMYDYFEMEWGTFTNIRAVSSTLYQGMHTYLNQEGTVFQETVGTYTDGSTPVLMSFTTSWINIAGVQGYERFYFMFLLGTYITPFKLNVSLGYDYNGGAVQSVLVAPDNFNPSWGGEAAWGVGSAWGGEGNVFEARIFPQQQKCESFQVSVAEVYDPSMGIAAGAGLTLSGLNLVVGMKKGYRVQKASKSFG